MLLFFGLTYAITWACFFGAGALSPTDGALFVTPLLMLGTFAPALVTIGLMMREGKRAELDSLLRRLTIWQVSLRWYVFAIGYMATLKFAAALAHRLIIGSWPAFDTTELAVIPLAIVLSVPVQAGEEIGWRGYALPRLAQRYGIACASLLLGLVWGCWHLPLFLIQGLGNFGQSFPMFVVGSIALSVAMAWLYMNTNGSLLLAMLMHSSINQSIGLVPTRLAVPAANRSLPSTLPLSPCCSVRYSS
jgi:uncharacterized protein